MGTKAEGDVEAAERQERMDVMGQDGDGAGSGRAGVEGCVGTVKGPHDTGADVGLELS